MTSSAPITSFLCVDDDNDVLALMASLLATDGRTVDTCADSDEALARVRKTKPGCVIVNMMMPGTDGLDVCRQIRSDPETRGTKVIIVSSKAYEFDKKRAYEFGADGYILKPINAHTFAADVDRTLADKVELTFWGVRGTLPVPGENSLRYGGNTNCVTMEFSRGQFFIFDAGSGIKSLANSLLRAKRTRMEGRIFISHPHWDHINALPFFTPLYMQGNDFEIIGAHHGDLSVRDLISAQMDGVYFPVTIKEFGAQVHFRDMREGTHDVDGITVKTKMLSHPGTCLGYRVEYKDRVLCYITDNEFYLPDNPYYNPHYVDSLAAFCEGADALITDTTYTDAEYATKVGWGHSCVSQVADFAHKANVKTLYLYHHDPDQNDDAIDAKLAAAVAELGKLGSSVVCVAPKEGDKVFI